MRKTMIAGNWKMHLNVHDSSLLLQHLHSQIKIHRDIEVVVAPTMLSLQPLSLQIDRRQLKLAAQNAYHMDEGAFTGEVSFAMLHGIADYVIVGHSERRIYFHEDNELIRDKVAAAVRNELTPIICIGETASEHQSGETKQILHDQLITAISNLTGKEIEQIVVAYEPIWAISTFGGQVAKPSDVATVMAFIREQVEELYGRSAAEAIRILYGGSVDEQTVGGYLEVNGCDGALVGGASLSAQKFSGIVDVAERRQHQHAKTGK